MKVKENAICEYWNFSNISLKSSDFIQVKRESMQSTVVGIWGAVFVCDPHGRGYGMERRRAGLSVVRHLGTWCEPRFRLRIAEVAGAGSGVTR